MVLEDPTPLVRWPDGSGFLAFWVIDGHPIWIEITPDGAMVVNGEPVTPVEAIRAGARERPATG